MFPTKWLCPAAKEGSTVAHCLRPFCLTAQRCVEGLKISRRLEKGLEKEYGRVVGFRVSVDKWVCRVSQVLRGAPTVRSVLPRGTGEMGFLPADAQRRDNAVEKRHREMVESKAFVTKMVWPHLLVA